MTPYNFIISHGGCTYTCTAAQKLDSIIVSYQSCKGFYAELSVGEPPITNEQIEAQTILFIETNPQFN